MRIRTQILAAVALAAVVAVAVLGSVGYVTRQAAAGLRAQADSQEVARDVASMLALTNEFVVYGGERSIAQWHARHAALRDGIRQALATVGPAHDTLTELGRAVDDLPTLFDALAQIGAQPATPLAARRRELLLERLMSETQEVVEARHRWSAAIGEAQAREQRLYTVIVLTAPAALLLLLVALMLHVRSRVLKPLAQLERAAVAIWQGDLSVRCADALRDDELGDAARAVDEMARALQTSQQRLRMITDSLPAFIGHIDTDERYTFANAHFVRTGTGDPAEMIGRTMRDVRGESIYTMLKPHIRRALAGETVEFETTRWAGNGLAHRQSIYVPDVDADGRVCGFYAMTFDVTERKKAEMRLAANERLLKNITDNVPALVAYIDRDHCYRFANSKYREWLGAASEQMVGKHVRDAVDPAFYDAILPHLQAALGGERVRWERQSHRDGKPRALMADYIPDLDAEGQVRGCYALTIDITERRAAEQAVLRSERQMLDLLNNIPAMVAYFDVHERCQYANDAGLRSQGIDRAQVPGITLRAALGESNYAQHEPYVKEALKGRRSRLNGKIPFPGRDAWFQAHLVPDVAPDGAPRGFYLMTFDITALKEAEHKQARVERQLRAITDNLPVLISYIDHEQRYVFLNATFQRWTGIEPSTVMGKRVADVVSADHYEPRRAFIERALAGERMEFEIDSVLNGELCHLSNVYIPDVQPDGRVAGLFGLSTDVTTLKQIEQSLKDLARVDVLTGLPNRRCFEERLPEAIARAKRAGQPLTLMFLDIDHFKSINDGLGHATGDAVLKEFGQRLRGAVRTTDLAARLAGDEFVVLLEGVHAEDEAVLVADKVVTAMRKPFATGSATLKVTTSVGVAFCAEPTAESGLMDLADEALYEAKAAGRNTARLRVRNPDAPARRIA